MLKRKYYYLKSVIINGVDMPCETIIEKDFALQEASKAVKQGKRVDFLVYDPSFYLDNDTWKEQIRQYTLDDYTYNDESDFSFLSSVRITPVYVKGWMPEERIIKIDHFSVYYKNREVKSTTDAKTANQWVQDGLHVHAVAVSIFKPSFDELFDEPSVKFTFVTSRIVKFLNDEQFITYTGMKFKRKI